MHKYIQPNHIGWQNSGFFLPKSVRFGVFHHIKVEKMVEKTNKGDDQKCQNFSWFYLKPFKRSDILLRIYHFLII